MPAPTTSSIVALPPADISNALGARVLASAPIPVTLKARSRHSLAFLRPKDNEIYCKLNRGRLHVVFDDPWKVRHIQVAVLIAKAVALLGLRTLPPFFVNTGDKPGQRAPRSITKFAACSVDGYAEVAAPDFIFQGWPEAGFEDYDAKTAALAGASGSSPRDDRAGWVGRCDNQPRADLLATALRCPQAVEVVDTVAAYNVRTQSYLRPLIPMEEQASRYRFLIDVEGFGYSGRLKLLLHAGRVVLLLDRPHREFFMGAMEPFRHYVPVARNASDLVERIEWLRANPAREAEIVREGQHFARTRLTLQAAVEAWAGLLESHVAARGRLPSGLEHLQRPAIW